jgi:hypothetical protein
MLTCDVCGSELAMDESREFAKCVGCGVKYPAEVLREKARLNGVNVARLTASPQNDLSDFEIVAGTLKKYKGQQPMW